MHRDVTINIRPRDGIQWKVCIHGDRIYWLYPIAPVGHCVRH